MRKVFLFLCLVTLFSGCVSGPRIPLAVGYKKSDLAIVSSTYAKTKAKLKKGANRVAYDINILYVGDYEVPKWAPLSPGGGKFINVTPGTHKFKLLSFLEEGHDGAFIAFGHLGLALAKACDGSLPSYREVADKLIDTEQEFEVEVEAGKSYMFKFHVAEGQDLPDKIQFGEIPHKVYPSIAKFIEVTKEFDLSKIDEDSV